VCYVSHAFSFSFFFFFFFFFFFLGVSDDGVWMRDFNTTASFLDPSLHTLVCPRNGFQFCSLRMGGSLYTLSYLSIFIFSFVIVQSCFSTMMCKASVLPVFFLSDCLLVSRVGLQILLLTIFLSLPLKGHLVRVGFECCCVRA
jgi:hypothetical protein